MYLTVAVGVLAGCLGYRVGHRQALRQLYADRWSSIDLLRRLRRSHDERLQVYH